MIPGPPKKIGHVLVGQEITISDDTSLNVAKTTSRNFKFSDGKSSAFGVYILNGQEVKLMCTVNVNAFNQTAVDARFPITVMHGGTHGGSTSRHFIVIH